MRYEYLIDALNEMVEEGEIREPDYDLEVYAAYGEIHDFGASDFDNWIDEAEEAYAGQYPYDEDFAQEFYDSVYGPELENNPLFPYVDWSSVAEDLMMDYSEHDGHYFRNL